MANQIQTVNGAGGVGTLSTVDSMGNASLGVSSTVQAEALAAQAEAEVRARWAIAQRNPRNWDAVRVNLLRECERPGFADVAKYSKPVGKEKVVGPSIRFVEAALRCMGNIVASTTVIADDPRTRRLQVMVTDLESNISWPRQITIEKTVERKDPRGRIVVYDRVNSYGEKVYTVIATEDELATKEAAQVSKAIRTAGLRILPGDLVEEAMGKVDAVRNAGVRKDPAGERKRLVDAFLALGVSPEMLVEYLGHDLSLCQPAEISDLRDLYATIKEGEAKWADIMAERQPAPKGPAAPASTAPKTEQPAPTEPPSSEVEVMLATIESCTTGKELAQKAGAALSKASAATQGACMAAYQAKMLALRGAGK